MYFNIKNRVFNYFFDYQIKSNQKYFNRIKKLQGFYNFFSRYDCRKSVRMLNLYYHELMGKIEEYEWKRYLMVDDYTLDKVLDKIKK